MSSSGPDTLLALENAVLVSRDGARSWSFDVQASGPRITLIGDFTALFGLLSGELKLRRGSARIGPVDATEAVGAGMVGLMRCDAVLPGGWTLARYLEESALLSGLARPRAQELARESLRAFDIEPSKTRLLATLSKAERRLLSLANAALLAPKILFCERPLDHLETDSAERVAMALERASRGRSLVASIGEFSPIGPERVLADRADRLIVMEAGRLTYTGPPSDWLTDLRLLSVIVSENWEAFRAALEARGVSAKPQGFVDALHVLEPPREGARFFRLVIELPAGADNHGVFEASLAARAPIVDLRAIRSS